MNFNLVSPDNQGNQFTTRFQEDITIDRDSVIYMNYAKLQKLQSVQLKQANRIDLEFIQPIPNRTIAGVEAYPQTPDIWFVDVPAGIYSAPALQQLITLGIQNVLDANNANAPNLISNFSGMYNANILSTNPTLETNFAIDDLLIGFQRNDFWDETVITPTNGADQNGIRADSFAISLTDSFNSAQRNAQEASYVKTTGGFGGALYDNYAIDDVKFYHYGTNLKAWENYRDGISTGIGNTRGTANDATTETTDTQINEYPFISFETDKTLTEIQTDNTANNRGGNFVGLISKNYMVGTPIAPNLATKGYIATAERYNGATTPRTGGLATNPVPICYLGVEVGQNPITPDNFAYVNIWVGANARGSISNPVAFPHNGAEVDRMNLLHSHKILEGEDMDGDEGVDIVILPYYKLNPRLARNTPQTSTFNGFVDRSELHYQVIMRSGNEEIGDTVLWDTIDRNFTDEGYFNGNILDGFENVFAGGAGWTENMTGAQIPFNVIVSSKDDPAQASAGLTEIRYTDMKEKGALQTTFPTIIDGLRFRISAELGKVITNSTQNSNADVITNYIYPSLRAEASNFFQLQPIDNGYGEPAVPIYGSLIQLRDMYNQFNDKSYSIYINNIPLRNYKNRTTETDRGQKGGIRKNILKTVPLPWIQSNSVEFGANKICYYEPNNKEISELKNQEFKCNSFDIEIRGMELDKPATEITKSTINFTIASKNSSLVN